MKQLIGLVSTILIVGFMATSCSTSDDPEGPGMVQMSTTLDNNEVSRFSGKSGDRVEGVTEEVIVSESRILISRLKFKQVSEDDESEGGDVHTGPSVMVFEDDATNVLFTESVPAGTYDRVKLEKHKFSSEEAEEYADDPVLGEFASPDRLTIIIDGIYKTSTEQPFTIKDDATSRTSGSTSRMTLWSMMDRKPRSRSFSMLNRCSRMEIRS